MLDPTRPAWSGARSTVSSGVHEAARSAAAIAACRPEGDRESEMIEATPERDRACRKRASCALASTALQRVQDGELDGDRVLVARHGVAADRDRDRIAVGRLAVAVEVLRAQHLVVAGEELLRDVGG